MSNYYWDGINKCYLEQRQIKAKWGQPGADDCVRKLAVLNRAFEVFYLARKNIYSCPDFDQQMEMHKELEKAATEGFGPGVTDLEEAFEHVVENGCWKDTNIKYYDPGQIPLYKGVVPGAPRGAVEFLHVMQGRLRDLRAIMGDFGTQLDMLAQTNYESSTDWERIGEVLKKIEEGGNKAKKYMWWADITVPDKMERAIGFVETLGKIHDGATYIADRWAEFDRNRKGDAAFRVGVDIVAEALGCLPILGDFYGKAVRLVIGAEAWGKNLFDNHIQRIDSKINQALRY
jgi:hypothetical protein